jgi:hypothetical protein
MVSLVRNMQAGNVAATSHRHSLPVKRWMPRDQRPGYLLKPVRLQTLIDLIVQYSPSALAL